MKNTFTIFLLLAAVVTAQQKLFTIEKIFRDHEFYSKSFGSPDWLSSGAEYTELKKDPDSGEKTIFIIDAVTGSEKAVLAENSPVLSENGIDEIGHYEFSPDEKHILITGKTKARRLKKAGDFYLYNIEKNEIVLALLSDEEQLNAAFSPDGSKIAFVRGNNIYCADIESGDVRQMTSDGSDVILNGHFDWVYEEEFGVIMGLKWSPDSKKIAFWRSDISKVPEIQLAKWDSLYFNFQIYRYPKPGAVLADVSIHTADVETGTVKMMDVGTEEFFYIPRINFIPGTGNLLVQRLNRLQNRHDYLVVDPETGKAETIITELHTTWIGINNNLDFIENDELLLRTSEKSGFQHLYLTDYTGKEVKQLTSGEWEVKQLLHFDSKTNTVFYTSNERGIIYQDLYKINLDGSGKERLTDEPGTHSVKFTASGEYYIDTYSNVNLSPGTVLYDINGNKVKELIPHDMSIYEGYTMPDAEFGSFTTSDGTKLNYCMIKPPYMEEGKKYPVFFYNYSGPGSQVVTDSWKRSSGLWYRMLAAEGYIIFWVDNRGTGGRGKAFEDYAYENLGYWEAHDQAEAVKFLGSLPFADTSRVGIWGWSYGGYGAINALFRQPDHFDVGISVAPVTDWMFYDAIYTERYMSLPSLNPDGYEQASVLNLIDNYRGKLLVIHGTADDNVHFQNTVELVRKLTEAGKPFETMFYPGKDHGIYGGKTRYHLFKMVHKFLKENL